MNGSDWFYDTSHTSFLHLAYTSINANLEFRVSVRERDGGACKWRLSFGSISAHLWFSDVNHFDNWAAFKVNPDASAWPVPAALSDQVKLDRTCLSIYLSVFKHHGEISRRVKVCKASNADRLIIILLRRFAKDTHFVEVFDDP